MYERMVVFKVQKVGDRYLATLKRPWRFSWTTRKPLTLTELTRAANRRGMHVQDFWDAVVEADPSIAEDTNL